MDTRSSAAVPVRFTSPGCFLVLSLVALLAACGGNQHSPPVISSLSAAKSPITAGTETTLTAVFQEGVGTVDQGVGAIASGIPKPTGRLSGDTTFTLTVTGSGGSTSKFVGVRVVPAALQPVISSHLALTTGTSATANVPGQTGCTFAWTISGGTFLDGLNTASGTVVSYTAGPAGTMHLACKPTNVAGDAGPEGSRDIISAALPLQPVITAPSLLVNGKSATASVSPQDGCTYAWSISGGILPAGNSTSTVTFTAGSYGYVQLSCTVINAAGTESRLAMAICSIAPNPASPVVAAPAKVTAGQPGYIASVPYQTDMSYSWSITGGSITSSVTTNLVTFTAGPAGNVQLACVITDTLGASSSPGRASCGIVALPESPEITAAAAHKAWDMATATVPAQPGCTYAWTVKGGTVQTATTGPSVTYTVAPNTPLRLACIAINGAGTPSSAASLEVPVTFTQKDVLKALGLDNPPPRKGADGRILTDSDHPIGRDKANLQKIDEIFTIRTEKEAVLYNPLWPTYNLEKLAVPQASTGTYQIPVVADTNGDGKQEIVLLCLPQGLGGTNSTIDLYRILGGATRTLETLGTNLSINNTVFDGWDSNKWSEYKAYRGQRQLHQQICLAAGDLDGDGRDELVFTLKDWLYVAKVVNGEASIIASRQYVGLSPEHQILRVDCADLDHDGKAEIVVTDGGRELNGIAKLSILQWTGTTLTVCLDPEAITVDGKTLRTAAVKVGDLEGNGKPTIVLCGLLSDTQNVHCTMLLQVTKNISWSVKFILGSAKKDTVQSNVWEWNWADLDKRWLADQDYDAAVPPLALVDLDGDGKQEIVASNSVLKYSSTTGLDYAFSTDSKNLLVGAAVDGFTCSSEPFTLNGGWDGWVYGWIPISPWRSRQRDTAWFGHIAAGRLSTDPGANDELLVLDQWRGSLRRYYYDPVAKIMKKGADIAVDSDTRFVCLADLDDDSTDVEYLGPDLGHELVFSRPIILAALASPPYWAIKKADGENIQNFGNSLTQFGRSIGSSVGGSAKVGVSLGLVFGGEAIVGVGANGRVTDKTTLKFSADFSFDVEAGYERSISYETYAGSDAVLFSSMPVDYYYYRVTKVGPGSKYTLGQILAVKKQRPAMLQFTDIQYFNDNNGNYPDIDAAIFGHTIGRPFTYPSLARAMGQAILEPQQWFLMDQIGSGIVPRGNLYNTMSYSTSLSAGVSAEFQFEAEHEVECAAGVLAGFSVSGRVGFSVTTKTTFGESISGSVGGLDPDFYRPENLYKWGIFSHVGAVGNPTFPMWVKDSAGKDVLSFPFKVINYWVEAY